MTAASSVKLKKKIKSTCQGWCAYGKYFAEGMLSSEPSNMAITVTATARGPEKDSGAGVATASPDPGGPYGARELAAPPASVLTTAQHTQHQPSRPPPRSEALSPQGLTARGPRSQAAGCAPSSSAPLPPCHPPGSRPTAPRPRRHHPPVTMGGSSRGRLPGAAETGLPSASPLLAAAARSFPEAAEAGRRRNRAGRGSERVRRFRERAPPPASPMGRGHGRGRGRAAAC